MFFAWGGTVMEILLALFAVLGLSVFVGGSDAGSDGGSSGTDDGAPEPTDGDDTVTLSAGADLFDSGDGQDSVNGAAGDDIISGGNNADSLEGGEGDDRLSGDQGFDDLDGGAGDDTLFGGLGKDLILGGSGDDELSGEGWTDGLFGGEGNDTLFGGVGDDLLVGGDDEDRLYGGDGDDVILAGDNTRGPIDDDSYDLFDISEGGAGDDLIFGGTGEDVVRGDGGDDILIGSDILPIDITVADYEAVRDDPNYELPFELSGFSAEAGNDYDEIYGGSGDDILILGDFDVGNGGDGNDDFLVGDWISDGKAAFINDFDSTRDILVVGLSDSNADAEITTTQSGNTGQIYIDGRLIATVTGSFDQSDGIDADVVTTIYGD